MANNKIKVSFKLEDIPMIIETLEKIQNENEDYKQALLDIKELINKQLLSNTNLTKYTDEMCLKDLKDIVNKALGDKENENSRNKD